jgi:hypothetical protein
LDVFGVQGLGAGAGLGYILHTAGGLGWCGYVCVSVWGLGAYANTWLGYSVGAGQLAVYSEEHGVRPVSCTGFSSELYCKALGFGKVSAAVKP